MQSIYQILHVVGLYIRVKERSFSKYDIEFELEVKMHQLTLGR